MNNPAKNIQNEMAQTEFRLCQEQIDKYDASLDHIRTWTVTLWVATLGWSFQSKRHEVILLSLVAVIIFWLLDAINKSFRQDYKQRRDQIAAALQHLFNQGTLPAEFSSPQLPAHKNLAGHTLKVMFYFHTALVYLVLLVISLLLYVQI